MPVNDIDRLIAKELSGAEHGTGSIVAGTVGWGSPSRKAWIRNRVIEPIMAKDISLGRKIESYGPRVKAFAERHIPKNLSFVNKNFPGIHKWITALPENLGNMLGKIFSENHLMGVGGINPNAKGLMSNVNIPAVTAPLSKIRNLVVPGLGIIGSMTLLNALAKRSQNKKNERAWDNSLEGGNNGQY